MKVFVDNFAVLGVENSLLNVLTETFSSDVVMSLDEDLAKDIAAETEDSRNERARVTRKLESLEKGLKTLNRLGQYQRFGEADSDPMPEKQEDVNLNAPATPASIPEELAGEERLFSHEEVGDLAIQTFDALETPLSLSPFEQNGSIRSDNSWLQGRSKSSKQKKGGTPNLKRDVGV